MPKEIRLNSVQGSVKFVNSTFTAYSDETVVPAGSDVVLLPSGNVYKIYGGDRKLIMNEGLWTLNGVEQPAPVFPNVKQDGFQVKGQGTVVIQGLGQGDYVETHMHRWQWITGSTEVRAPLRCVHVYADGIQCDAVQADYGVIVVMSWGSRYYHKEGKTN